MSLQKLSGNHQRRPGKRSTAIKLMIAPLATFLILLLCFFALDDFMLYANMLLLNKEEPPITSDKDSNGNPIGKPGMSQSETGTLGDGLGTGESIPYADGVAMMLANAMKAGVYQEYIAITRDHCNWKYMNDAVKLYTSTNGTPLYPTIASVLGGSFMESGLASDGIMPETMIDPKSYGTQPRLTLAQCNSASFKKDNFTTIADGYDAHCRLGAYATQFQMSFNAASVFPDGKTGASRGAKYPSKMNGYGIPQGTVRGLEDTDMAYFPDQLSMFMQFGYSQFSNTVDMETLTPEGMTGLAYAIHNGGAGIVYHTWATGGRASSASHGAYDWAPRNPLFGADSKWNKEANTITLGQAATSAVNYIGKIAAETSADLGKMNPSRNEFYFNNHGDYEGFTVIALLLKGKGFIATDYSLSVLKQKINEAGFQRGALTAYKICMGDTALTVQQLKNYVSKIQVTRLPPEYGPAYQGKGSTSSASSKEVVVHCYDPTLQVYNKNGAGPMKLVHAYNSESARGFFAIGIMGARIYWKMLLASGVEVTYEEAVADGAGRIAQTTYDKYFPSSGGKPSSSTGDEVLSGTPPPVVPGDDLNGSYYTGTRKLHMFTPDGKNLPPNSPLSRRSARASFGIHAGEDYSCRKMQLRACAEGIVTHARYGTNYGRGHYIRITMKSKPGEPKIEYIYQHLESFNVEVGQHVMPGDIVAVSGNSPGCGYHLHLDMKIQKPQRNGSTRELCFSYYSVYKNWYTIEYAPLAVGKKKININGTEYCCPGEVYDKDMNLLGYMRDLPIDETNIKTAGVNHWIAKILGHPIP